MKYDRGRVTVEDATTIDAQCVMRNVKNKQVPIV